jgi:hypothetical protein
VPMAQNRGWISYGSGDNAHLTEEQRPWADERIRQRREARGGLLGVVEVRVYENSCEPQVSFPEEAILGVEIDAPVISDMGRSGSNSPGGLAVVVPLSRGPSGSPLLTTVARQGIIGPNLSRGSEGPGPTTVRQPAPARCQCQER